MTQRPIFWAARRCSPATPGGENEGKLPAGLEGWFTALARYSHAKDDVVAREYARQIYTFLIDGVEITRQGEDVRLEGQPVTPDEGRYADAGGAAILSPDYGPALWSPASTSNYTVAARPIEYPMNYVIIHVTQGSYASAINWFQNPAAQVSAHYVVRSSDGQITQTVREKDVAWHAGNWSYNTESVGIEHEGYVSDCTWFTVPGERRADPQYRRQVRHPEGPEPHHRPRSSAWRDPHGSGPLLGLELLYEPGESGHLVHNRGQLQRGPVPGQRQLGAVIVQHAADYAYATRVAASDAAYYRVNIPSNGTYDIYMWYPANPGYNASTPVVIWQANTNYVGTTSVTRTVNQQVSGGTWVLIGNYRLLAGDSEILAVSRCSKGAGYVIADAFKIVRR